MCKVQSAKRGGDDSCATLRRVKPCSGNFMLQRLIPLKMDGDFGCEIDAMQIRQDVC